MSHLKRNEKWPRLRVGANVASGRGLIEGVDPFTRLIVTRVHKDGTVDITLLPPDGRVWKRVHPRAVVALKH